MAQAAPAPTQAARGRASPSTYPIAFALAVSGTQAPVREALLAFAFGWAENMMQAAIKSVPLGQSAGQRILARLAAEIPAAVDHALALGDDERQAFSPDAGDPVGPARNPILAAVPIMSHAAPHRRPHQETAAPARGHRRARSARARPRLLEMLCKAMRDKYDLVAITNDIYTKEDQRLLTVGGALPAERIMGVETGGCPHTAIREDASINLEAIDRMLVRLPRRRHRLRRIRRRQPGRHLQPRAERPDAST